MNISSLFRYNSIKCAIACLKPYLQSDISQKPRFPTILETFSSRSLQTYNMMDDNANIKDKSSLVWIPDVHTPIKGNNLCGQSERTS